MQLLLVLAHPRPKSFNHALASAVLETAQSLGHTVVLQDLYVDGFNPVLQADESFTAGTAAEAIQQAATDPLVLRYRNQLRSAHALVVVHPNWWGKPPAMMSGWIDRVLIPGVAYQLPEAAGLPKPLLNLEWAAIFNTGDTPPERERAELGDPLELIWRNCILGFCGVSKVERRLYGAVAGSSLEERMEWLEDSKAVIRHHANR